VKKFIGLMCTLAFLFSLSFGVVGCKDTPKGGTGKTTPATTTGGASEPAKTTTKSPS